MNNLKKTLFLCSFIFMLQTQLSFAQFGVGIGLVGGLPVGDFGDAADFGFGGYLEPKYLINDNIAVGVYTGGMVFAGSDLTDLSGLGGLGGLATAELSAFTVVPLTVFGDYMFVNSKVTPYAGLAVGPYFISGGEVSTSVLGQSFDLPVESSTEFGFAPRVGVLIGKFNLGAAYHIVSDANFITFRLGFDIGARRDY